MAVRGLADQALNSKSMELLKSPHLGIRLAAAHFFARGAKDFGHFKNNLIEIVEHDSSTEVKMAVALAFQKIKSDSTLHAIEYILRNESDYRVKINAIRALQAFPLEATKPILTEALNDPVTNVGIAASEVIKSTMTDKHWRAFNSVARNMKNWRIQANLYEASIAVADHKELAEEIRLAYDKSIDSYQRAALLTALQHSITSHEFVREQLMNTDEPVVRAAAATALTNMNYSQKFPASLKQKFAKIYQGAIGTADAAVIGIIANTLSDSTLNYKSEINDYTFLKNARNKLSLPKDFESIAALEMALSYFEGKKFSSLAKNEFNHPIDWELVKKIPFDQRAIIKTSKGDITIRLLVNEAPGSVANFVALALSKYYNGKFFHRVVPNFVVQGGCPRGDGYGSEAYSIRSEFYPRRYQTGSIGMASAGKDTEGTQWFITHSPTPHLEGRYTLFAEVEDGMDIVHKIEVGDKILSIDIIDLNPH
jgi:cyclophilin family peptidyl-prolyl cis-trans isomerase